ncbi:uncharacterized protein [Triticum aestivum]|uniref:Protein kinase domain-containing protein n=2 Tax=Triticum aestivum TaxID=4565 RepID=A0A3B6DNU2_WHEAT|nr:uncharacterized protein LOC123055379 isoform X1 [Triticum aestivum]XP_044335311.1 uncharacterized protein LOC123055379 isoform X1 [Triticum aestivum]XP_044335312.1 uncharacterized protein LOC123055379 isoform X1 [Triticum aestivum]
MEPTSLPIRLLEKITDNFSEERLLGQGAYGKVYRGVYNNGQEIAVKLLHNNMQTIDDEQFIHEFDNLMMLNHPNIVRLVGYCYETQRQHMDFEGRTVFAETTYKALCFEYMPKGSLQNHLSDECNGLDWQTRYKIIKGACEGLKYLHEGFKEPFYHLDIKPDNMLLDENMTLKLADFGLSKFYDGRQTCRVTQSPIAGTIGYMPPEYLFGNVVSKKFDIFSLGVVMTKIIVGPNGHTRHAEMHHQEFLDQVQGNWRKRLQATWSPPELVEAQCQQVKRCIEIALSCMEMDRHKRPSVVDIIHELNKTETFIEKITYYELDPSPPLGSTSNVVQPATSSPPSSPTLSLQLASSRDVEVEAAKLLHKLILESKDEPTKMARKLYVICQHMKLSGKEQSLPYQVISRAMEILVSQHGIDMDALGSSRVPFSGRPQAVDSSGVMFKDKVIIGGVMFKDKVIIGGQSPVVGRNASQRSGQAALSQFPSACAIGFSTSPQCPHPMVISKMSPPLFRTVVHRKSHDGLLKITDRVYVLDSCFTTDVFAGDKYQRQHYIKDIVSRLKSNFANAHFLVSNFREGRRWSQSQSLLAKILNSYDMTVMEYPRQYEGCPILTMEMIYHFLKSADSWLSVGQDNVMIMHCERGGWSVLAFMLAGLLLCQKKFTDEQKMLEMVYKQAPRELIQLLSPINPMPSQIRYLQYISHSNINLRSSWLPGDRPLTLDNVLLISIPDFNGESGCSPIFRIYGHDPLSGTENNPKVVFSTAKKYVRLYKQGEDDGIKIDVHCHIQGDVVLECTSMDAEKEREEIMFRLMFNTSFIRSDILVLDRDEIDMMWDAKDRFPENFKVEVMFSEMAMEVTKENLPVEAFEEVQEIFSNTEWLDSKENAALESRSKKARLDTHI